MQEKLRANLWKYFLLLLSNRRNYIPILAVYFLTLPNATAQQIGLYTGIGWLVGFLMETPSGYFSDKFGHKRTLIMAKFAMLASTLCFIFGDSLPYFIFGSAFISFAFAFTSGTTGAFLHNTLTGLKREKEYGEVSGKASAKVSLVSAAMILLLPLFTNISLLMPIKIYLVVDVVGIFMAFSLYSPKMKYDAEDEEGEKIWSQLKRFKGTGFYPVSIFIGIVGGFFMATSAFRSPFMEFLGMPIIFIGSAMALSRVVWFVLGHNLRLFRKIKMQNLLFFEIFFFSGLLIISSQMKNPYALMSIFAIASGYYMGRSSVLSEYYLNNFLVNKRYKATMLSIKKQIERLIQSGAAFGIGCVMAVSFSFGFLVVGIVTLIGALVVYPFARRALVNKS